MSTAKSMPLRLAHHSYRKMVQSCWTATLLTSQNPIILDWPQYRSVAMNWGDKLNPYLIQTITGRSTLHPSDVFDFSVSHIHYVIGSHLSMACSQDKSVVWGSGFISKDSPIKQPPQRICAVRGWRSFERLRAVGIACPEIVGDPALLMPRIYKPNPLHRRYRLGLIAHWRERDEPFFLRAKTWPDTLFIDITGDIEYVVDQIAACDYIASSSLHGIICADAYGVPSVWLHVSDKLVGDGFKFFDYFSSVGRAVEKPISVNDTAEQSEIIDCFEDYEINIDLESLWNARPF